MGEDVAADAPDQKAIYEQRCADFRSLNGFLWQSPLIIMSLTGGLWFAVASFPLSDPARSMLLLFAGLANILMIGALIRLRWVMQSVLRDIRRYDGKHCIGGNYIIVGIFSALLTLTALGSFVASCHPGAYFTKPAATKAVD
ncbi:conserved membrane hypothetical protein [Sphingomonas sp. EC-HK361]|uniref:hypothetical protein n=1 Tax=Sphingomonas sp. EC-HK361 TaxID=2038397 RepID=UPI00125BC3A5|nr:hypothetical protein [Sphingomonas sp. EC-HK361]VVT10243.1 conserved membrane hypothetical protein [Sphingomonas sp. EC-HK361]